MKNRAEMSGVRFKVRYNALLLQKFTVADLIHLTGLNPESVRTELQRMKKEGFLISKPGIQKPGQRGGRSAIYQLAGDPEKRLALSRSVEAFYPSPISVDRPTSRHYYWAQRLINKAQTTTEVEEREKLLREAAFDLKMAEQAEGGSLASDAVRAYLQFEQARIVYIHGNFQEAELTFITLREFFSTYHNEEIIRRIDEFLLCLKTWAQCKPSMLGEEIDKYKWASCLLDTLTEIDYQTDNPLILAFWDLLRKLPKTIDKEFELVNKLTAEAFRSATEASQRAVNADLVTLRSEYKRLRVDVTSLQEKGQSLEIGWLQRSDQLFSSLYDKPIEIEMGRLQRSGKLFSSLYDKPIEKERLPLLIKNDH